MVKRIVILQPGYLPWLGFFDQVHKSDIFVIYDDVQYTKRSWRNRNKIKTSTGWMWLTVPVIQKGEYFQTLLETKIDNTQPWRKKHWASIRSNYSKAPFFKNHSRFFEDIYKYKWESLVDLNTEIIKYLMEELGIKTQLMYSSKLKIPGKGTERLIKICQELGATHYLTGDLAKDYLEQTRFAKENIILEFQNYKHPIYPQLYDQFIPYLSVIDLMFNCGKESLNIILGRKG